MKALRERAEEPARGLLAITRSASALYQRLAVTLLLSTTAVAEENRQHAPLQKHGPFSSQGERQTLKPSNGDAGRSQKTPRKIVGKRVVVQFAKAMQLYDAGKLSDALLAFDLIHTSYPVHEPTTIQYAKTLYRLDRIPESYNLFALIKPQYLDPESSYEYGYAFYIQNQFEGALYAFKRVPSNHPLFDLASYYGAMSALQLKKYGDAAELLDKALVLPDKLARSKNLYQKHVASLKRLQEKSDLERAAIDERQRIAAEHQAAALASGGLPPSPPESAASGEPSKYVHGGFYLASQYQTVTYDQYTQASDLHGAARRAYQSKSSAFLFGRGALLPLSFKLDNSRQSAVGADIGFSVASLTSEGTYERLVAYEDSRDIIHSLTVRQPKRTTNTGDVGGRLWIEAPLPSGWWLGTDGHLGFTYPNFARGQRYGSRGVNGHLGWLRDGSVSWTGEFSETYDLIVDAETKPLTSQMISNASLSLKTKSLLTVKIGAKYIYYDYKLPVLPGPDTSSSGTLTVSQAFPFGITTALAGTAEKQENYIARYLPTFLSASGDGQLLSGVASLSIAPREWLAILVTHTRATSHWIVREPERENEFNAATPNYTDASEIKGSLMFNF